MAAPPFYNAYYGINTNRFEVKYQQRFMSRLVAFFAFFVEGVVKWRSKHDIATKLSILSSL